jgi:hypothetical protein
MPISNSPSPAKSRPASTLLLARQAVASSTMYTALEQNLSGKYGISLGMCGDEIVDNSFADNLEKSGFLKEQWGGRLS